MSVPRGYSPRYFKETGHGLREVWTRIKDGPTGRWRVRKLDPRTHKWGDSFCGLHDTTRFSRCIPCNGESICEHGRMKNNCLDCGTGRPSAKRACSTRKAGATVTETTKRGLMKRKTVCGPGDESDWEYGLCIHEIKLVHCKEPTYEALRKERAGTKVRNTEKKNAKKHRASISINRPCSSPTSSSSSSSPSSSCSSSASSSSSSSSPSPPCRTRSSPEAKMVFGRPFHFNLDTPRK